MKPFDSAHHRERVIHGLWHDGQLPEKQYVDSWRDRNPEAIVKVWTFAEAEKLMCDNCPEWVAGMYERMPFLLQRANILRVVILAVQGGIYLDLDMECLRPLDKWFGEELTLGNVRPPASTPVVCNAVLGASHKRHRLWSYLLKAMRGKPARIARDTEAIMSTGSLLLGDAVAGLGLGRFVQPQPVFFPSPREPGGGAFTRHHAGRPAWAGKQFINGKLHENQNTPV